METTREDLVSFFFCVCLSAYAIIIPVIAFSEEFELMQIFSSFTRPDSYLTLVSLSLSSVSEIVSSYTKEDYMRNVKYYRYVSKI